MVMPWGAGMCQALQFCHSGGEATEVPHPKAPETGMPFALTSPISHIQAALIISPLLPEDITRGFTSSQGTHTQVIWPGPEFNRELHHKCVVTPGKSGLPNWEDHVCSGPLAGL